jgi:hypothetical protein
VADTRFIGVDLAWREGSANLVANETGVAVIDGDGQILDAGWTRGVQQTTGWADRAAGDGDAVMFADAPLAGELRVGWITPRAGCRSIAAGPEGCSSRWWARAQGPLICLVRVALGAESGQGPLGDGGARSL